MLTLDQLFHACDFRRPVYGVDGPDTLGQVHVVGQSSGQVGQKGVQRAEPLLGDGVNDAVEVAVPVAVEADLLGLLLWTERAQGAGPVQAAVRAVRGTGEPGAPRTPPGGPLRLVPLIEVLELHGNTIAVRLKRLQT